MGVGGDCDRGDTGREDGNCACIAMVQTHTKQCLPLHEDISGSWWLLVPVPPSLSRLTENKGTPGYITRAGKILEQFSLIDSTSKEEFVVPSELIK